MHGESLQEILVLLLAAVFVVAIFKRLRLSPVLGYLVAGGAIGPYGFTFNDTPIIADIEGTRYLAEFGVVFLLFAIGLELTFDRLKSMRKHVFGFGSAQMVLSGTAIGLVSWMFGATPETAIIIGGGLALSSTAIVLQVLSENSEQATQVGRLSLAVLILQDLAVVPLLILVTLLAQDELSLTHVVFEALVEAVIVLAAILLVGKGFLRPLFRSIASLRSQELFLATTLLILLGAAWATEQSGLSLALGAFVAGLLVAETEFRMQVQADIESFKGLLMGLFFMTVGMSIDFVILKDKLPLILAIALTLIATKALIVTMLSHLFGFRIGTSIQSGLLLSQGSEFAFVLFALAATSGVMTGELSQILLIVVPLTMALTPLLANIGRDIAKKIELKDPLHLEPADITRETIDLDGHIIVVGFGRVGKTICSLLKAENINNYVAFDNDPKKVTGGSTTGLPVFYGNAEKVDTLKSFGIERARIIVVTIPDKKSIKKVIRLISKQYPDLTIVARAWDRKHADELREAGASVALAEAFESSLMLGSLILKSVGVSEHEIMRILDQFRAEQYPISHIHKALQ